MACVVLSCVGTALPALAEPTTSRTVNIDSPLTLPTGNLEFDFFHRFSLSGGKVSNSPTFLLGTGMGPATSIAVRYATNSDINGNFNEFEPLVKQILLGQGAYSPLDLTGIVAYNSAAVSGDGALVMAYHLGPLGLLATLKGFTDGFGQGGATVAGGLGIQWQLTRFLQVSADLNGVLAARNAAAIVATSNTPAWSLATAFEIPYSPHSVSLFVTNANTATLEGTSRGGAQVRTGFEFTIPFDSLARWEAIVSPPPEIPSASTGTPGASTSTAPEKIRSVEIKGFRFEPSIFTVPAGTTVRWTNQDPVAHTSTGASWDSGILSPGCSFERRFDRPGTYAYFCRVHPFMHGTVVVK